MNCKVQKCVFYVWAQFVGRLHFIFVSNIQLQLALIEFEFLCYPVLCLFLFVLVVYISFYLLVIELIRWACEWAAGQIRHCDVLVAICGKLRFSNKHLWTTKKTTTCMYLDGFLSNLWVKLAHINRSLPKKDHEATHHPRKSPIHDYLKDYY